MGIASCASLRCSNKIKDLVDFLCFLEELAFDEFVAFDGKSNENYAFELLFVVTDVMLAVELGSETFAVHRGSPQLSFISYLPKVVLWPFSNQYFVRF